MPAAALACVELLFWGWGLRVSFAAGTATTRSTGAPGWTHLLQLLELFRRQDLLELRLHLGLQGCNLLLLILGQVQVFHRAWGQQMKPALSARTTRATGAAFVMGRALPVGRWITVLRCNEPRRSA